MNINFGDMKEKLILDETDLVSPVSILEDVSKEIEEITKKHVKGVISPYDGAIKSHSIPSAFAAMAAAVVTATEQTYDIQEDLGEIGYEEQKYDFCLAAPALPNYKYRVMFFSLGIGRYPVELVLQEDIGRELLKKDKYIVSAQNQAEFETIIQRIVSSAKVINVVQELYYASQQSQAKSINAADVESLKESEKAKQ